jgi:hypothetical protein
MEVFEKNGPHYPISSNETRQFDVGENFQESDYDLGINYNKI